MCPITIEDLSLMKFLSCPRISPNGHSVAYVVTTIDPETQEYRPSIWVAPIPHGAARSLTKGTNPSWSPDGLWIAYEAIPEPDGDRVSARHGRAKAGPSFSDAKARAEEGSPREESVCDPKKAQIWVIAADGGEARQLTFLAHGASAPSWSPDGQQILFCAPVGPVDEVLPNGKPLPKMHVIDHLGYCNDGTGFTDLRRSHLFVVDQAGGEARQLTDGDCDDSSPAWSPDGASIAFVANRGADRWQMPKDDLYLLFLQDGQPQTLRQLTDGSLSCHSLAWSPDGQTIAFIASPKLRAAEYYSLYTAKINSEEPVVTCLTRDFAGTCMDLTNSDIGDEQLAPPPGWAADGQTLYFLAAERGATRLYALPSTGADEPPVALTPDNIHVRDFSMDQAGNTIALLAADPQHPQEIFAYSLDKSRDHFPTHSLSRANANHWRELTLAEPELITFAGAEDWPIDGWILKPPDFDAAKQYPLIVEIHGGPHSQYGYGFFHEMQLLAAQGYIVFYANPRGSVGYGYDFANAVRQAWGEKPGLDILRGIDAVCKRGFIDEQRIGVIGGSYGGYLVNWLVGHSDRFAAAITDRSVSNMSSMFGTSDIGWYFLEDHLEALPWQDPACYLAMSPLTYAHHIHTPLLIIHGEQDLRCPLEQAQQLFIALKCMGREVQLAIFEGQSHGLSRGGHPKLRQERLRHIIGWFAKYLK